MTSTVKEAVYANEAASDTSATLEREYGGPAIAARSYDLRERKRTRTRLAIQAEAIRLFAEKGYETTTVEDIAYAAAISPRTFFRYFPTKEDVVIWDEYDPVVEDLVAARPADEPAALTARAVMVEALGGIYRRDRAELLTRVRLLTTVPELRARLLEAQSGAEKFASMLARRRGADELQARVVIAALGAIIVAALDEWQRDDGKSDLLAIFDRMTKALVEGVSELA
jgi:AcrR family transcriptional regulator